MPYQLYVGFSISDAGSHLLNRPQRKKSREGVDKGNKPSQSHPHTHPPGGAGDADIDEALRKFTGKEMRERRGGGVGIQDNNVFVIAP